MKNERKTTIENAFLQPGCLKPYLEEFIAHLTAFGYTSLCLGNYIDSVCHFGSWITSHRIPISAIDDKVMVEFADHHCDCPGGRRKKKLSRNYNARVRLFVRFLADRGLVEYQPQQENNSNPPAILEQFKDWLIRHRGLSYHTVERYCRLINQLLPSLGNETKSYNANTIRSAIGAMATKYLRITVQGHATALRAYLRFVSAIGECRPGLEHAVPHMPNWRFAWLPRYLVAEDIEKVIATCDGKSAQELRDRAILLLLARLGLRAGDIITLRLEDVKWYEGTVRFCGKGRREVLLPLPQDVGDALLEYLEKGRACVAIPQIFLCLNAPYRAIPKSSTVSGVVRSALLKAGIANPPSYGANLLRHSAATAMLRGGASLDTISTVLRHRSINTTTHYAKVNIPMLERIAQPWPGGTSC